MYVQMYVKRLIESEMTTSFKSLPLSRPMDPREDVREKKIRAMTSSVTVARFSRLETVYAYVAASAMVDLDPENVVVDVVSMHPCSIQNLISV